jgi:tetratricopeptide (TPR) repeat protein
MKTLPAFLAVSALLCATSGLASTPDPAFDEELLSIQQAWAKVNYEAAPGKSRLQAFDSLEKRAEAFTQQHPTKPEALIWEGIIESSYAGAKGGLGALSLCKEARGNLEAAIKLDPMALDGAAFTSLGALFYKVPGFPISFGDDTKALELLQQALKINPNGIDPNYFYAELLYQEGDYAEALHYLEKAAHAAPRPGRELADQGRRAEVAALAAKARKQLT